MAHSLDPFSYYAGGNIKERGNPFSYSMTAATSSVSIFMFSKISF
jgi:hypothetical protein